MPTSKLPINRFTTRSRFGLCTQGNAARQPALSARLIVSTLTGPGE
jgi:hypothetical protein